MNRPIVKSFLPFVLLLFAFQGVWGQGYGDKWIIGTPNVLVTFDSTYQLDYFDTAPNFCTRLVLSEMDDICDKQGNVQFYYNGDYIISFKTINAMDNGDSLDCCLNQERYLCASALADASIILPSSLDSNKYYVYQTNIDTTIIQDSDDIDICSKLLRHTVDMSYNNGDGEVTNKNEVVFRTHYLLTRLAATKHANGRDWWLLGHGYSGRDGNDLFYIWLIQNDSVQLQSVQETGSVIYWLAYGKTTFSPDGSKLAMVTADDTLNVFDFDRCLGLLSNPRKMYIYDTVQGSDDWLNSCAFSADSRFLYTSGDAGKIRQFDMTIANLDSAMEIVGEFTDSISCMGDSGENGMGDMQLAPDGKIYISPYQGRICLHLINYPEIKGSGCGYVQDAITLYPKAEPMGGSALPNMPNYTLGALTGSACDTLNSINNLSSTLLLKVFPNPANDIINIEISNGIAPDNISIIDVTGRVWRQLKPHQPNSQLNIAALPQGVYFVQIQLATRVMVCKVVKE